MHIDSFSLKSSFLKNKKILSLNFLSPPLALLKLQLPQTISNHCVPTSTRVDGGGGGGLEPFSGLIWATWHVHAAVPYPPMHLNFHHDYLTLLVLSS